MKMLNINKHHIAVTIKDIFWFGDREDAKWEKEGLSGVFYRHTKFKWQGPL